MSGEESLQESDLAALGAGILIEQDTLIRTMKGSGKKLRKNRKRADQMLALRSIIPEVASRCETREEVSERELEETHRTVTASIWSALFLFLRNFFPLPFMVRMRVSCSINIPAPKAARSDSCSHSSPLMIRRKQSLKSNSVIPQS